MLTRAPRWRHHGAPKALAMGPPRRGEHDVPDHDVRTEQLRARESGRQRWCSPASRDPHRSPTFREPGVGERWCSHTFRVLLFIHIHTHTYVSSRSHSHQLNLPISRTSLPSFLSCLFATTDISPRTLWRPPLATRRRGCVTSAMSTSSAPSTCDTRRTHRRSLLTAQ